MRGKLAVCRGDSVFDRITPADAGKTSVRLLNAFFIEDHPRGCGENLYLHDVSSMDNGSPPRMRGKHAPMEYACEQPGITPADAGKTVHDVIELHNR